MIGIGQIEVISTDPSTPYFPLMVSKIPARARFIGSAVNRVAEQGDPSGELL